MAYIPPASNAVDFTLTGGYTPPAGNSVDFTMSGSGSARVAVCVSVFSIRHAIEAEFVSGFSIRLTIGTEAQGIYGICVAEDHEAVYALMSGSAAMEAVCVSVFSIRHAIEAEFVSGFSIRLTIGTEAQGIYGICVKITRPCMH